MYLRDIHVCTALYSTQMTSPLHVFVTVSTESTVHYVQRCCYKNKRTVVCHCLFKHRFVDGRLAWCSGHVIDTRRQPKISNVSFVLRLTSRCQPVVTSRTVSKQRSAVQACTPHTHTHTRTQLKHARPTSSVLIMHKRQISELNEFCQAELHRTIATFFWCRIFH